MKNIFKKLSQVDITQLRNIDVQQLKSNLSSRQDILINIIFFGLTLFATLYLWQTQSKNSVRFKKDIKEMTEKVNVVEEQEKVASQYQLFKKNLPQTMTKDQVINQLSELAIRHNVQMTSLSPIEELNDEYVSLSHWEMSVTSNSYQNLVDFTKAIENSPYAVRLKEWTGQMQQAVGAKIVMESLRFKE